MKKKMFIGLIAGLLLTGLSSPTYASIVYTENQTNATGIGWSNTEMTNAASYGLVHGLWGNDNSRLNKIFSLSGKQTEVTIDFRYWAISTWDVTDGDIAKLEVNNNIEWFSTVEQWNTITSPWIYYPDNQFPNNNYGRNLIRYQDISITVLTTATSLDVNFIGILNHSEDNESWAVSSINIHDNSPVPVPGAVWLLGSGLAGLVGLRRKKK